MNGTYDNNLPLGQNTFDRDRERRLFSRVGLALLTLLAASTVGALICQYAALTWAPWLFEKWWFVWILSFVPIYGVGLPAMWLVLRRVPHAPHDAECLCHGETCPKGRLVGGWIALLAVVAFGYMYIGSYIGNVLMSICSSVMGRDFQNPLNDVLGNSPMWANILCSVILAPIGEELLFRKLLGDRLRRWGDKVAILLTATFFALFHGNLFQFFYAFLLGLILGYLYTRTGKLRYSIALHAGINLIGGILLPALSGAVNLDALNAEDTAAVLEYVMKHPLPILALFGVSLLIYAAMAASVILTIGFRRRLRLGTGQVSLPRGDAFAIAMGNVGMATATVLFVLNMAASLLS